MLGNNNGMFIGICGMIGAGKSTLAEKLGKIMNMTVFYEEVTNNDYLTDFYNDMKGNSFLLQIHLLNNRLKQLEKIKSCENGRIQDRTIYEDLIFAEILHDNKNMDDKSYATYQALFSTLRKDMLRPNLIIFIDVSAETSLERIKERNREIEKGITIEYLKGLYDKYQKFIIEVSQISPVIKIDWNEIGNEEETAKYIQFKYNQIHSIHT